MTIHLSDLAQRVHVLPLSKRGEARLLTLSDEVQAAFRGDDGDWSIPWETALLAVSFVEAGDKEADALLKRTTLDESDLEALGAALLPVMPPPTPLRLSLRLKGLLGSSGCSVMADWQSAGRTARPEPTFEFGLGVGEHGNQRLRFGQLAALQALPSPDALAGSRATAIEAVSRFIDGLVPNSGVEVTGQLAKASFQVIDSVAPRLDSVGNGNYQARPTAQGIPSGPLEDHFYGGRSGPLSFDGPDGRRTRAVLSDRAERGLRELRRIDKVDGETAAHAISHPEAFFGADLDTSALSDRVIGLGPPIRRVHASLKEVETQDWFDWDVGLAVETLSDDADASQPAAWEASLKEPELRQQLRTSVERADELGDHFIPDPTGDGFIEVNEDLRQALRTVDVLEQEAETSGGHLRRPPRQVLQVHENLERVTYAQEGLTSGDLSSLPAQPPGLVEGIALKPHQQEGFRWLQSLFAGDASRGRGAMLADDMGLGKTLQVLSLLRQLQAEGRRGPHLVVAPVALLDNWKNEAKRFFGHVFEPMLAVVGKDLADEPKRAAAYLQGHPLVLVSYDTLRQKELHFAGVNWDMVILDEAQRAKEVTSQTFRVVRTLNARGRIAMTGTPVENKLLEFWALFDWSNPGLLGDARSFQADFTKPLREAPSRAEELASALLERIRPVYRRRMKSEVARDLPAKHIDRQRVPLTPDQVHRYGRVIEADAPFLGKLPKLLGLCAHPELDRSNDSELPAFDDHPFPRAEALFEILDKAQAQGEKVLVFANRRAVQRWLAREIEDRYETIVHVINGEVTNSRQRLKHIDFFSRLPGFAALVLAPRAAGVGLNIQAANHVVHYMREWNPAIENQATDRAYRIGQTREVYVHYMIATAGAKKTVEERLDDLLEEKRALMDSFVVPIGNFAVRPKDLESE